VESRGAMQGRTHQPVRDRRLRKVAQNTATGVALQALLEKNDPSVTSPPDLPDDYTVKVTLSLAAGWFLPAIAVSGTTGAIVDQNVVKTDFDKWWTKPETLVGTVVQDDRSRRRPVGRLRCGRSWWGYPGRLSRMSIWTSS